MTSPSSLPVACAVGVDERLAQSGNGGLGALRHAELIGVGAPVRADRDRLAAPDELGSAQAEALPAPHRVVAVGMPSRSPSQPSIGLMAKRSPIVSPATSMGADSGEAGAAGDDIVARHVDA